MVIALRLILVIKFIIQFKEEQQLHKMLLNNLQPTNSFKEAVVVVEEEEEEWHYFDHLLFLHQNTLRFYKLRLCHLLLLLKRRHN